MASIIGHTLAGKYRIDEHLGSGGMAAVYKAWDQERAVYLALKLLREDLAQDRVFLRRFKREANTLAKLQHPNIVRFYGLEQDGDIAFMVMDFVDGAALRKDIFDLDGKPMPGQRVLQIMQAICSALHFAHNRGMVHCDIKPGNIMLDKGGRVLVTDFGIARMSDAATATMVGMGTPAYMPPELIRGQDPSPRTDLYSLGVILFEMVTGGERPFTGDHAKTTGSTSEKVRWEQMHRKPPPPSNWNQSLSQDVEAVVLRCLEKDRRKRFDSAVSLLNALAHAYGEDPTLEAQTPVAATPTPSAVVADPIAIGEPHAKRPPAADKDQIVILEPDQLQAAEEGILVITDEAAAEPALTDRAPPELLVITDEVDDFAAGEALGKADIIIPADPLPEDWGATPLVPDITILDEEAEAAPPIAERDAGTITLTDVGPEPPADKDAQEVDFTIMNEPDVGAASDEVDETLLDE